ncbi:MAG: hypothetical protein ACYC2U_03955 [Candidatus Amoebophilus sp.]
MEEFDIGTLPIPKKELIDDTAETRMKMFVDVSLKLAEEVSLYGIKHNMTKQEILLKALQKFMEGKTVISRPDAVKQRKKKGRKTKY